jgi:hypothetical protein
MRRDRGKLSVAQGPLRQCTTHTRQINILIPVCRCAPITLPVEFEILNGVCGIEFPKAVTLQQDDLPGLESQYSLVRM